MNVLSLHINHNFFKKIGSFCLELELRKPFLNEEKWNRNCCMIRASSKCSLFSMLFRALVLESVQVLYIIDMTL